MNEDFTSYRFSDAIIPAKHSICGLELRPFCLGHYLILEYMDNPIVNDLEVEIPTEEVFQWFFMALLVCSFTYEENLILISDEKEFKSVSEIFFNNLKKNMENDKEWNIFSKMHMFRQYIKYHMHMPIYSEERDSDSSCPSGTDWKQNIFIIFKKLGYSESEILNMSMKKMFCEWCSYAESEGAIKVMNKYDLKQLINARKVKV